MNPCFLPPESIPEKYRPVPFWSWNDRLEPEELCRQIKEMHDAGIGGFFMHARGGLLTEYMGKEWMESIALCVREARKLGMKPYLYDENGWPSGFGNGKVNGVGEVFQQKYLRFASAETLPPEAEARIICRYPDGFVAYFDVNPYYVDNMVPEVVECFIENIYEFYWKNLPEDVRLGLAGIFTDEPQLSRNGIPWSLILEDSYRKRWGEELLPLLPELFRNTGNYRRTRIRYYRLCAELFQQNFIEKIGTWCKEHNWEFTGHHVLEETFDAQLVTNGAVMPQYTGYSIPGVDHLMRVSSYVTADIQCVSVAAQTGKPQILAETFGCSGWNFNFHGMKWLWQQHMAHGVNLLCQHLTGYSLRGLRKRDYPASISYHHPMWKDIKPLHDAFSRTGYMLANGRIQCRTLVLHAQSTAWMYFNGVSPALDSVSVSYFRKFAELSQELDKSGIPFHYGDEILMSRMAEVRDDCLVIGEMQYDRVVIPVMENISSQVLGLLKKFRQNGGMLFRLYNSLAGELFVDGVPAAPEDLAFFRDIPVYDSVNGLIPELKKCTPGLEINVLSGVRGQIRGTWRSFPEEKEHWYFLADFDTVPEKKTPEFFEMPGFCETVGEEKDIPAMVTLPYPAAKISVVDQETGKVLQVLEHMNVPGKGACFLYRFNAAGSVLLCAEDLPQENTLADLTSGWQLPQETVNVLTIDRASYRLPGEETSHAETDTISIFNRLLRLPGDTALELKYSFHLRQDLDPVSADLKMAVEPDENAEYFLNGVRLENGFTGEHFIDRLFQVIKLPETLLRSGDNVFEVRTLFTQRAAIRETLEKAKHFEGESNKLFFDSEVEAVYLLGHFGCYNTGNTRKYAPGCMIHSGPFELGKMPETLSCSDFTGSGLPFFSGSVTVSKKFTAAPGDNLSRVRLKFAPFRANSASVSVNGRKFPPVWCAPYELDISQALHDGENEIVITFVTSRRNTLGPLHQADPDPYFVGPGSFYIEPGILGNKPPATIDGFTFLEFGPETLELVTG